MHVCHGMKLTDEDLADSTTSSKAKNVLPHSRVAAHKVQSSRQFASASRNVHANPLANARGNNERAEQEVRARDEGAHHVVGAHHLRASVRAEGLEDVVLGAVGEAVKEQVDGEQKHAPRHVGIVGARRLLALAARVQREDGNAKSDGRNNEVLVQRVALAEDGDVQEHDGQQLAALGEQKGNVVNMRQTSVSKGAGETAGDGNKGQRGEDTARGDDRRERASLGGRGEQVDAADGGSKERLDRVEEDGEVPYFGGSGGAVSCCRELFLKICPGQAILHVSTCRIVSANTRSNSQRGVDASNGNDELQNTCFRGLRRRALLLVTGAIGSLLAARLLPCSGLLVEIFGRRFAANRDLLRSRHCGSSVCGWVGLRSDKSNENRCQQFNYAQITVSNKPGRFVCLLICPLVER